MAEGGHISMKRISDITECSICMDSCKDPRFLPCIHTFCLRCLKRYGQGKRPGENLSCPMCRKVCTVPRGGIEEFPANYFTNRLIDEINLASSAKSAAGVQLCEMCCAVKERTVATLYCMVCLQQMCEPCCARHKTQRMAKGHQVVAMQDKPSKEEQCKLAPSYCEQHPTDEIKFYCYDCKTVACFVCYVAQHNKHKCGDVKEWAESFRTQLNDDIERVTPYITKSKEEAKDIQNRKRRFNYSVEATKREITKKFDQLISALRAHKDELMTEVDSLQATTLEKMEVREREVNEQTVILDSFKMYCEEMRNKGTACDVARDSGNLHARADELVKTYEEFRAAQPFPVDISFNPSSNMVSNSCIGKLALCEIDTSLLIVGLDDGLTVSEDVYRISLRRQDSMSAMKATTDLSPKAQACARGNSVFVTGSGKDNNQMWRLDLSSGGWFRRPNMITGRRRHCSVIVDSQLFVLGGWADDHEVTLSSVECYNTSTRTWSPAGNLVHAVQSAACVTYKNSIYVFGGFIKKKAIADVQLYYPTTQLCILLTTPMPAAYCPMRAVLWETFAILMQQETCLVYNFETKTWQQRNQFKTGVNHFGLVVDNQAIYVAGGGTSIKDKDKKLTWACTDEIKSVSMQDIIEDKKPVVWKHHAILPKPALIHAFCCIVRQDSKN